MFFAGANSPADCPGYPFGGGYFDVYGVAFNLSDGDVGEFFSNGVLPGNPGALYAAADTNSTTVLDEPNAGSTTEPNGVLGSFTASAPEPNTLLMLLSGAAGATDLAAHRALYKLTLQTARGDVTAASGTMGR